MNAATKITTTEIATGCLAVNPTGMTHDEAVAICETLTPIKGTPPEVGWWMCSFMEQPPKMRWWNGTHWSVYVSNGDAEMNRFIDANLMSSHDNSDIKYFPRVWEKQA